MKEQLLDILRQLETVDLTTSPNFIALKALANAEEALYPSKALVAASLKIDVNAQFVNDPEIFKQAIKTYVLCLNKLWLSLVDDFGEETAGPVFLQLVKSMSLTYTF